MKNIKYIIGVFLSFLILFNSCQEEEPSFGALTAPTNIDIQVMYADGDDFVAQGPGDGTGVVNFIASANNAISYQFVYNGSASSAPAGKQSYSFAVLGLQTYAVTVVAFGRGGISSSKTIEVEVLSTYSAPADLLTMLTSNTTRTWRIAAEVPRHFGLGPVGGSIPVEWYPGPGNSDVNYKVGTGMYDDRYTFNINGTFTHDTGADGNVFGREVLIEELAGPGGTKDGADILNYPYASYSALWSLSAPGGVETLSLTGTSFMGYYTGGNHKYRIFSRSANEMLLSTADGNNGFEWWFILIPE